ncbi:hypothetical protein BDR07DRAFT_1423889 [Suillus spraguei]|nr:hypothetical protein BDR07DRAFT_1443447 [Suillus spraguei]KAG2356241.1 hypothetical protein BDR07DRAFT_1423889 [Suillus spraguei]
MYLYVIWTAQAPSRLESLFCLLLQVTFTSLTPHHMQPPPPSPSLPSESLCNVFLHLTVMMTNYAPQTCRYPALFVGVTHFIFNYRQRP